MNKVIKYSAIALAATAIGVGAVNASGRYDDCPRFERGEGRPHHAMMHHDGKHRMQRQLNLSAEQVKTLAEARLIMRGNERLKVGEVTQKDDNTYSVQIVTVDGSLVREFDVDKDRGFRHMGRR